MFISCPGVTVPKLTCRSSGPRWSLSMTPWPVEDTSAFWTSSSLQAFFPGDNSTLQWEQIYEKISANISDYDTFLSQRMQHQRIQTLPGSFQFGDHEPMTVPPLPPGGSISHRYMVSMPFYFYNKHVLEDLKDTSEHRKVICSAKQSSKTQHGFC